MGGAEREDESLTSPTSPSPSSSNPTFSSPSLASFQREAFRKAIASKSLRRFLEVFMETQMFTGFIQERDLRRQGLRGTELWICCWGSFNCSLYRLGEDVSVLSGLFEVRAQEYLDSLPGSEHRGVNKFLKGLGETSCSASTPLINQSVSTILWSFLCLNLHVCLFFQETRWNSFPRNDSLSQK